MESLSFPFRRKWGWLVHRLFALSLSSTLVFFTAPAAGADALFMGLGDLPGRGASSASWGVSANGSTAVGGSQSILDREAFRWTFDFGMEGLVSCPGSSQAKPCD